MSYVEFHITFSLIEPVSSLLKTTPHQQNPNFLAEEAEVKFKKIENKKEIWNYNSFTHSGGAWCPEKLCTFWFSLY